MGGGAVWGRQEIQWAGIGKAGLEPGPERKQGPKGWRDLPVVKRLDGRGHRRGLG